MKTITILLAFLLLAAVLTNMTYVYGNGDEHEEEKEAENGGRAGSNLLGFGNVVFVAVISIIAGAFIYGGYKVFEAWRKGQQKP